jgi:hypothetical protein|tara:strand:- start:20956 stop:23754 length:2799 start_codon:yes stop_codon:yes gene_type:complete
MEYTNLRFFKDVETDLNLVYNSNTEVFTGRVFLNEVSTGLYETVNLFLLQEVVSNSDLTFNYPRQRASALTATHFEFEWNNDAQYNTGGSTDIIMYHAEVKNNIPVVTEDALTSLELGLFSDFTGTDLNGYNILDPSKSNTSAMQVNIALKSEVEGPHSRNLCIYEKTPTGRTKIAEINFYGEVVAEDTRLSVLLHNLGATLSESDFLLFKSHDISELSPDQILLNQKRKELLLELHNIKPFVGTYKAILNAIDFFGYNNITLKEYWLNVDSSGGNFGKLHAVPVPNSSVRGEMIRKKQVIQTPSKTMKKTSKFSLVYRLNEPNGTYDQWDIPNVTEIFEFTPEEILIKLYGLKQKLQLEYLPLNSRIIDITAEGDYFTQKNINVWNTQNPVAYFSEGHDIEFKIDQEERALFVEDMALVIGNYLDQNDDTSNYNKFLNYRDIDYSTLTSVEITELRDIVDAFYANYHDRTLETWNTETPVGCPIILNGIPSFDDIWDEALFTWEDADPDGIAPIPNGTIQLHSGITWDNWWKRWVYEIEWIVTGRNGYNQSFRGAIDDYIRLPIFLPHNDIYTVEMRTYDLFGHRSHYRMDDLFVVNLKDIELYGIYKWLESFTWNDKVLDWNKSGGYWDNPQNNKTTVDEHIASLYLTLDRANYQHDISQGVRFSTVRRYEDIYSETGFSETTGPYQWDESTFRWLDSKNLWWNATRVGPDQTASFKLDTIESGTIIKIVHIDPTTNEEVIGTITITSPTPTNINDISAWQAIANELNTSTDPIISKFNFNPVFDDIDNNGFIETFYYILAVGKEYSYNYDFSKVFFTPPGGAETEITESTQHVVHYNPTFDDTRVFMDYAEVERSTHVTISADGSKFPGLKNPVWNIKHATNPANDDIYYNNMWLTYIFKESGFYSIELNAEDTYGNKNVVKRNMIKVK